MNVNENKTAHRVTSRFFATQDQANKAADVLGTLGWRGITVTDTLGRDADGMRWLVVAYK